MKQIRWGILGCGRIARKFAADLRLVEDAILIAAGSRSIESVKAFAEEFPLQYEYASYLELVKNPEIDVIYVASPHAQHHEHTLLCLNHGKAVLCEKAFALNEKDAKEMIDLARTKKIFLMEALWTKFMPHYELLMQWIRDGKLGSIQNLSINFGFAPTPPVPTRLLDPTLGGGSLLDIGIYNVFMAISVLGVPDTIEASMTPAATGVDEQCAILFKYKSGAMAQLLSSFSTNLATEADIAGREGRIRLTHRFYEPSTTIEYYPGRVDTKQVIPFSKEPGWGYHYEIKHVNHCLRQGLTESPIMSHTDTLTLIRLLDQIRAIAGIKYKAD